MIEALIEKYVRLGMVRREHIGIDQIDKHLRRAAKDLKAATANVNIDAEVVYNYAYLSMLRSGRALMFLSGVRPTDGQQHRTVVVFADAILGTAARDLAQRFDRARQKRNRFTYDEPDLLISEKEAVDALDLAREFVTIVEKHISKNKPQQELAI